MEGAQKDERTENQGDRSFIQRGVYTQYCGYNTKGSDISLYAIAIIKGGMLHEL